MFHCYRFIVDVNAGIFISLFILFTCIICLLLLFLLPYFLRVECPIFRYFVIIVAVIIPSLLFMAILLIMLRKIILTAGITVVVSYVT